MVPISLAVALAASAALAVNAQESAAPITLEAGNPAAETGQTFNQPTKSWSQWQPKPTYAYSALPDRYMGDDRAPPVDEGGYQWDQSGYVS